MGKFKFKFENIARIKESLKKKNQRDIALIENKILKIQQSIEKTKSDFEMEKQIRNQSNLKAKDLQFLERHEIFIKKKINSFENEIEKLKVLKNKKLEELKMISRDEKMLEILREKHFEKFTFEEYKAETKAFDELAIRKAGRSNK